MLIICCGLHKFGWPTPLDSLLHLRCSNLWRTATGFQIDSFHSIKELHSRGRDGDPCINRLICNALQVAGAYGMTLLYGVVPPLMAWRLQPRHAAGASPMHRRAMCDMVSDLGSSDVEPPFSLLGNQPMLAALCTGAICVALSQALADSGHPDGESILAGIAAAPAAWRAAF